ncbi:hypothetical protein NGRA_2520 [Nosema granulosis]|uniref:Uncharacterized protein n=1 Tax=Nosema granulosis TaxID=83296 RepID=A0A9P6GZ76_9MICR|nr:hypothetical protein NGRA_2520 [Nosema granulosis]
MRIFFIYYPRRKDEMVIIGRNWMSNKSKKQIGTKHNSLRVILEELCKEKEEGLKGFECEINTEPGKRVVDGQYRISQGQEQGEQMEDSRLLKKGYITESKYTWLNNVKPDF